MDDKDEQPNIILFVIGFVVFSIGLPLLWKWHMAEPFGLPEIDVPQAFGLSFLSLFFFGKTDLNTSYTHGHFKIAVSRQVLNIFTMLFCLFFGYIAYIV